MASSVNEILAHGQAYTFIYVYLAMMMIIEAFFDNRKLNNALARISIVILILFIGLRWETGTDWQAYLKIFYTQKSSSDYDEVVFGIDKGYIWFNEVVRRIIFDYSAFLLIDASLAIAAVYYFIERSTRLPNMGVYLFYTSYAVTHFMGSNRRMLAIGLVCVGFLSLTKEMPPWRSWRRWGAPFAIAAMFHRTSIMALPGLFSSRRAWPAPLVIGGLLVCVILGMSGAPFAALEALGDALSQFAHVTVVDKLLFYTSGGESQAAADFDAMTQAVLGVIKRSTILAIFIAYMRMGNPPAYAQRLYNIYVIGCAIYFLMIGSPVFQVVSTYYTIVEIVLLPIIFSQFPEYKVAYIIYLLIVPLLLLVSALSPYLELYVPYRSIFTTY